MLRRTIDVDAWGSRVEEPAISKEDGPGRFGAIAERCFVKKKKIWKSLYFFGIFC